MSRKNDSGIPETEVLLAAYNGEKYISAQLDSLLKQTCKDVRVLVRDDGSSDGTTAIIADYARQHPQSITVIDGGTSTGSAKANFLKLLQYSSSDYTAFSDQDDVWEPDKLELCLRRIKELEAKHGVNTPVLVFTDLMVTDCDGGVIAPSFMKMSGLDGRRTGLNYLFVQNVVTGCTMLINRALRDIALRESDPSKILMHDHWLALIASGCGHIGYLDIPTMRYRQHSSNSVGANRISSPVYLLKRLIRGGGIRKELDGAFVQARELLELCGDRLTPEGRQLTEVFCSLRDYGKLRRLSMLRRYRFYKSGTVRKIAEFIWI